MVTNEGTQSFKLIDNIPEIKVVAASVALKWRGIFEINELINEAWIRGGDEEFATLGRLRTAVHCDMIDYVRSVCGRQGRGRVYKNGAPAKDQKKGTARLHTNTIDSENSDGEKWNPYEKAFIDKRFKQIDDQEFIDSLFKKVEMADNQKDVLIRRHQYSMGPNQISAETGIKPTTVFYYIRKNLRMFHAIKNDLDKEWVLKHKERLALS